MLNDYGKSLFKPWLSVPNVVIGLVIIFLLALMVRRYELTSGELAAWVQAVGSIAAIFGAFAISQNQSKRQELHRVSEYLQKQLAYCAVVQCAASQLEAISFYVQNGSALEILKFNWTQSLGDQLEASLNSLKQIPSHEFGRYELVAAHSGLVACTSKVIDLLNLLEPPLAEEAFFRHDLLEQCRAAGNYWKKFESFRSAQIAL